MSKASVFAKMGADDVEELAVRLFQAVEKLGAAGALIFALLWWQEKREHRETKRELAASQEKRIEQAMTVTGVVESCRSQLALVLEALKGTNATYEKILRRLGGRDER